MKKYYKKFIVFYTLFGLPLLGGAQTINTGQLVVMPGTQFSTVSEFDNKATGVVLNDGESFIYNHYNNDGLITFSPSLTSGLTRMIGNLGAQNISGTGVIEWFDVVLNNTTTPYAFLQSNDVVVYGNCDFENGIVDNDNYGGIFIFEDDATHNFTSNGSHVDGLVSKIGDDVFQYPIGDSGFYRYASQSNPDLVSDTFSGKYFFENSNALYPHINKVPVIELIDDAEYWYVEKTSSSSDIFLTLTWDAATTPAPIYASPESEMHIVRWDETQNIWVDEGGVANPATNEITTVVNPLTGYGVFTLARVNEEDILPCGGRGVVIYNAVSPNDDGLNDYFIIDGIDACPQNKVSIFNRWGAKVFETNGYNTTGNVFDGTSEAAGTISESKKLPTGTYFYIIDFLDETGGVRTKKAGYLYLNNN